MVGVYTIRNTQNGKIYVGSSVNIEERFEEHRKQLMHHRHNNSHLQSAWDKYGESNFEFNVIEVVDDVSKLREVEEKYITQLHACDRNYGYNILPKTNIGLGVRASSEVRKKISDACKGDKNGHYGKPHSEETRRHISEVKREAGKLKQEEKRLQWISEKHSCEICGIIMSEKWGSGRFCSKACANKSISLKNKSIPHTDDWNNRISKSLIGREISDEHRRNISDSAKERLSDPTKNPMYGKHHSEETKAHLSEVLRGVRTSKGFTGKSHTEETKRKISESLKRRCRSDKK